jgi:hypothetical protein
MNDFDPATIGEIVAQLVEPLARRIVEVIQTEGLIAKAGASEPWLDAQEVARQLGMTREWVYEHADELGATRLGTGPRPRLRFPPRGLDGPDAHESRLRPTEPPPASPRDGLIPVYDG